MARARLREIYDNELAAEMIEKFGYKNPMQVPKLDKTVVSMGVGEVKENTKVLEAAVRNPEITAGQKVAITKSKKSVANSKICEDMPIGCKATLHDEKMYEFAGRLINLTLPRVRDFRGVNSNSLDDRGDYVMDTKEQLIFPEIEYDKIDKVCGMDIIFVITIQADKEARYLLTLFDMPFAK